MAALNTGIATGSILEAILPFSPDDSHKGTYLVLRIAGADARAALRMVNRKYRTWQDWRSTDEDFYRLDESIPMLRDKFGGEARVLRTAMLDIHIIEAGIMVFRKIMEKEKVSSDMWAYATKLAGLRVPLMKAAEESGNPWERLANSIHNAVSQRELSVREIDENGVEKIVTAKETQLIHGPTSEQTQLASTIVEQVLSGINN